MKNNHNFRIQVWFRPTDYATVRSDDHVSLTHQLTREFCDKFADKIEQVVVNPAPLNVPGQPWIGQIDLVTLDKNVLWNIHKWIIDRVRPHLPEAFVSMEADAGGASVAYARWVPLDSDWYNVELGKEYRSPPNQYPRLCASCNWQDFDLVPEPFYVDGCIASAGKNEFLPATNGVFVVSARVHDLLLSLACSDFKSGPVVSRGKKPMPAQFFWIRPIHRIGGLLGHIAAGDTCPGCGTPARLGRAACTELPPFPLARIVEHFGEPNCNLALVGDEPLGERSRIPGSGVSRNVVISGGLFAVLWNHGIKGLQWPREGPCISRLAGEATWEATRRFGEMFPPAKDKALKYQPKL